MKRSLSYALCLMLTLTLSLSGCGGAPETDAEADQAAQQLENDPDYEQEMMRHMQGGGN
ncbi:MAG: hypothetical protein ACF8TS_18770 [Maioricimonas sp. JB049]